MIAIILAGGLGTRLRAAVNDRPKVLAPVAGNPFLEYVLTFLSSQGIRRVILSIGYLGEQVKEFAGNGQRWDLDLSYSEEHTPLGTGGALRLASQGLDEPFFALNGDTLFLVDLARLYNAHRDWGALATIALLPVEESHERGCVVLDMSGKILSFDEKPVHAGPALVNGGVYVLEPEALDSVPDGQRVSIERQVFPRLASEGRLYGQVQHSYFSDIGTPENLAAFERDVLAKRLPQIVRNMPCD